MHKERVELLTHLKLVLTMLIKRNVRNLNADDRDKDAN